MIEVLNETQLATVVAAFDSQRFVNKTVYGCGCGSNHGATLACPVR